MTIPTGATGVEVTPLPDGHALLSIVHHGNVRASAPLGGAEVHDLLMALRDTQDVSGLLSALWSCETVLLCDYIERTGGGFFQDLSRALRRADPGNRRTIYRAFSLPLYTNLKAQREWASRSGGESA